jgi:hypothetical protein
MAIEIVELPIKNGDFPSFFVNVYRRVPKKKTPTVAISKSPGHWRCTKITSGAVEVVEVRSQ